MRFPFLYRRGLTNLVLGSFWAYLAWRYLRLFLRNPTPEALLLCAAEILIAVYFVWRHPATSSSKNITDWLTVLAALVLPLFFRPGGPAIAALFGRTVEIGGMLILIASLVSLGRSFGIVPALREVKTGGAYRLIRHPMYLGYLLIYAGYVWNNPTPGNLAIGIAELACFVLRIQQEEKFLSSDPSFQAYTAHVRWRLLPYLY